MWIVFLFSLLFVSNSPAIALDNFKVSQLIHYQINQNGQATVKQEVKLINNLSQVYPKEYQIQLSSTGLSHIRAYDQTGNILKSVTTDNDLTTINLVFNQPAIGKDQITQFNLTYNLTDFSINKGKTWEISLPRYQSAGSEEKSLEIKISVPESFGKLSFSSIPNLRPENYNQQYHLNLNHHQITDRQILFIFGDFQLFDFNLKYFLENTDDDPVNTEIALPPDTNYQKIIFKSISPSPQGVYADPDGNWLAKYQLPGQTTIEINVSGQVKITPPKDIFENPGTDSQIQSQKYWPTTNQEIIKIAKRLTTPQQIYNYVVNTLDYDYQLTNSFGRQGADQALIHPQTSLCTEFTDLFVTLSRINQIPSREIEGFAYTNNPKIKPVNQNTDILHAWPQFYDSVLKRWVSVDPTWEKTTNGIDYFHELDLNHFTFVIHGQSSDYPPPAGSYKNNQQIKTVDVNFADQELELNHDPPTGHIAATGLWKRDLVVTIRNTNLNSLNNVQITQNPDNTVNFLSIPPLGEIKYQITKPNFLASLLPVNRLINLTVTADEFYQPIDITVSNSLYYLNLTVAICALIVILCILGIILTATNKKKSL